MQYCRKQAFSLITTIDSGFDLSQTITDLDAFTKNEYNQYICKLIDLSVPGDTTGYNLYLRYTTDKNIFPEREDLHVGRICCQKTLGNFIGFNRCDRTNAP